MRASQTISLVLPIPDNIILTFQNPSYVGEMKQRWEEIKKLKQI